MNFDSYVHPVWQLPACDDGDHIRKSVKYHCFVDNKSLCGRQHQRTDIYDDGITVDSGEIARSPQFACKRCRGLWMKIYCQEAIGE